MGELGHGDARVASRGRGTAEASNLAFDEVPTLPTLGTIRRWIPGGAAAQLLPDMLVATDDGLIDLDTLLQDWMDGPDFTCGVQIDPRRVEMAYERDG